MRFLYSIFFYMAMPFILIRLFWRSRKLPAYRQRVKERFGFCPKNLTPSIWIHVVSVGETIAAIPFIKKLQTLYPNYSYVITTMTPTGAACVNNAFGETVTHLYLPYDLPDAVRRFLKRIQPKIGIIFETELWPNLFSSCERMHIPLVILNARLSEESAKGYKKIRWLVRTLFSAITLLAAQSEEDANRFKLLGLLSEKITITGNIKFDLELPSNLENQKTALHKIIGDNRPIWIAASTHAGEEEIILEVHRTLLLAFPNLLLILVPRHPDRFREVEEIILKNNFSLIKRSTAIPCNTTTQVYLGDTLGELLLMYSISNVVFVGGSIIPIGGHNLLEPALLKKPILTGPYLFNFSDISKQLTSENALTLIYDKDELKEKINYFLSNTEEAKKQGERAYQVVLSNRGVIDKQLNLVKSLLN